MKRLLLLCPLGLALAGCEQTRPPTEAGRKLINSRTATGTIWTKLEVRPQPAEPVAGQVTIWDLKIFRKQDKEDGTRKEWKFFNQLPNIDTAEATTSVLMNAWLISEDGSVFLRSRPVYKAYGSFVTDWVVPRAGQYTMFVEYQPIQKDTISSQTKVYPMELARKSITVKGSPQLPPNPEWKPSHQTGKVSLPVFDANGEKTEFGCEVNLIPLRARTRQMLSWKPLSPEGKADQNFQSYVVALGKNGNFTHYRGTDAAAIFSEPGLHKLWFCFENSGQRYYSTLTANVLPRALPGAS